MGVKSSFAIRNSSASLHPAPSFQLAVPTLNTSTWREKYCPTIQLDQNSIASCYASPYRVGLVADSASASWVEYLAQRLAATLFSASTIANHQAEACLANVAEYTRLL